MSANKKFTEKGVLISFWMILFFIIMLSSLANAQVASKNFAFKIYKVNSLFYPFVQCYFRTFDLNKNPLVNVNEMNIALMVKGRVYDPFKRQYYIHTRRERREGFRTVIILDSSKTMAGKPFKDSINAITKFIKFKKPSDQVAIIGAKDEVSIISDFDDNTGNLLMRLSDSKPDGENTHLYDAINRAYEMCAVSSGTDSTALGADGSMNYLVGNSVIIFSDGKDEGSKVAIENIMARIERFIVPIYSVCYSKIDHKYLKRLESLSEISLGKYWKDDNTQYFSQVVEQIHDINNRDYVLTFRAYLEPDGENHNLKIGIKYEGKVNYSNAEFEAVEIPRNTDQIKRIIKDFEDSIRPAENNNPYYDKDKEDSTN